VKFPPDTFGKLNNYVYGLLDGSAPFYIGRGVRNRCFSHVAAAQHRLALLSEDGEDLSAEEGKFNAIRAILYSGREPEIVIYRYGLTADVASEIEATLISLFDQAGGLSNQVRGYNPERGPLLASDFVRVHGLEEIPVGLDAVACVKVSRSFASCAGSDSDARSLIEAAQYAWFVDEARRSDTPLLLPYSEFGEVLDVFRIEECVFASDFRMRNPVKFPEVEPSRCAFILSEIIDEAIRVRYVNKKVPARWRQASVTYPRIDDELAAAASRL